MDRGTLWHWAQWGNFSLIRTTRSQRLWQILSKEFSSSLAQLLERSSCIRVWLPCSKRPVVCAAVIEWMTPWLSPFTFRDIDEARKAFWDHFSRGLSDLAQSPVQQQLHIQLAEQGTGEGDLDLDLARPCYIFTLSCCHILVNSAIQWSSYILHVGPP